MAIQGSPSRPERGGGDGTSQDGCYPQYMGGITATGKETSKDVSCKGTKGVFRIVVTREKKTRFGGTAGGRPLWEDQHVEAGWILESEKGEGSI